MQGSPGRASRSTSGLSASDRIFDRYQPKEAESDSECPRQVYRRSVAMVYILQQRFAFRRGASPQTPLHPQTLCNNIKIPRLSASE